MKTKLLLYLVLFGSLTQITAQEISPLMKTRPADYEYLSSPDSLGVRHQLKMPNIANKNSLTGAIKIPYPIIFIHGLDSYSGTWNDFTDFMDTNFNFTYGGRLDFNLNDDNSNYTSNKLFYPVTGADIAQWTTTLNNGDYYYLNFAVGSDGSFNPSNISSLNVLSNEAAIAKQGAALKRAIQQVMDITGRDKVILFGHSMGGLAAREYLQNPINWQSDGNHHIAKIVTTGTPHGGYTGTNAEIATGIDGQSEAYRDLRKSYSYTGYDGVYLYGGIENSSVIKNILLFPFYNVDVNCNGINGDNSNIIGLNQRQWRTELDYSYIVGVCNNCGLLQGDIEGDGIVRSVNANLSNFTTQLPNPKNEFIYTASQTGVIGLHSELPQAIPVNMQGLDEPNEYNLAYGIELGKDYKGFITQQPVNGYAFDYDDYKFTMPSNGSFNITINNSFSGNLPFRILNATFNTVYTNLVSPNSTTSFTEILSAGQYYLEFYATPSSTSYLYPYTFIMQNTLSIDENLVDSNFSIFPNPTNLKVNINSKIKFEDVEIYNVLGQLVLQSKIAESQDIDMSSLTSGTYFLKLKSEGLIKNVKILKN